MDKKDFDEILKPNLITVNDGIIYFMAIDDFSNPKYETTSDSNKALLEIKSLWLEPILQVERFMKTSHTININFRISGKKAKMFNRRLCRLGRSIKPYKYYGVGYKNLSLKQKLKFKIILNNKF